MRREQKGMLNANRRPFLARQSLACFSSTLGRLSRCEPRNGQSFGLQAGEINDPTGVLDVDAHHLPRRVEVQDDPLGDFAGRHARLFRQVDVEGIRILVVVNLHALTP